jgi:hypothetical protein
MAAVVSRLLSTHGLFLDLDKRRNGEFAVDRKEKAFALENGLDSVAAHLYNVKRREFRSVGNCGEGCFLMAACCA